uniref:Uncharacterized protein n=1 Tax=Arundo donax TaxID=35708 RepID=A0A0A8Y615_ARUDO
MHCQAYSVVCSVHVVLD